MPHESPPGDEKPQDCEEEEEANVDDEEEEEDDEEEDCDQQMLVENANRSTTRMEQAMPKIKPNAAIDHNSPGTADNSQSSPPMMDLKKATTAPRQASRAEEQALQAEVEQTVQKEREKEDEVEWSDDGVEEELVEERDSNAVRGTAGLDVDDDADDDEKQEQLNAHAQEDDDEISEADSSDADGTTASS